MLRERVFHLERPIWKPTGGCLRPLLPCLVFSWIPFGRVVNRIALLWVFLRDLDRLGARRPCPCLVVNELREILTWVGRVASTQHCAYPPTSAFFASDKGFQRRLLNLVAVPWEFLRGLGPLGARRPCPCLVAIELRERVFHLERPIWKPTGWCVRPLLACLVFSRVPLGRHGNLIALP